MYLFNKETKTQLKERSTGRTFRKYYVCLFVKVWFGPVVLVTLMSREVLTSEGSRAPSADTEVVMPLFCRSMLRLRTGPRGGCKGLAEAERGHRWHSGKGHSHRRARRSTTNGRRDKRPSWAAKQQRAKGKKNEASGRKERGKEGERGREGRWWLKCRRVIYKGTRAQKSDLLDVALWGGNSWISLVRLEITEDTRSREQQSHKISRHSTGAKAFGHNMNTPEHQAAQHTLHKTYHQHSTSNTWHCKHISHRYISTLNAQFILISVVCGVQLR